MALEARNRTRLAVARAEKRMDEMQNVMTQDMTFPEYVQHLEEVQARASARQDAYMRDRLCEEDPARWVVLDEAQKDMMVRERLE